MEFYDFPPTPWAELLPSVPTEAVDLVQKLLRYQSSDRLAATGVSIHQSLTQETRVKAEKHIQGLEASVPGRVKLKALSNTVS